MPTISAAVLRTRVEEMNWVHQIDLGNGIITPGRWPPHPLILQAYDAIDFRGKKVLDVGCWDGLWSFEAERRGALEVVAIDDISQRSYKEQPTFKLAHEALGSRVRYYPDVSVYDLPQRIVDHDFDVAVFSGVYYHLKDPLLALAKIRQMLREGGQLIIEGDVLDEERASFARFYYQSLHCEDPSNWWVPTIACLREWVECSFFGIEHEFHTFDRGRDGLWQKIKRRVKLLLERDTSSVGRYAIVARATKSSKNFYIFPDKELCNI